MEPLYIALANYRIRHYAKAAEACQTILNNNPQDQAAWCLKLLCLSGALYVDELEQEDEGIADSFLDDNNLAQVARPGTSLNKPSTSQGTAMPSQSVRPRTMTGRPLSGVVRPGTRGAVGGLEKALKAPRTAATARPATSTTGRAVRLGTYIFYHAGDVRNALQLAALATQAAHFNDSYWKMQLGKCYYRLSLFRDAEKQFKSALNQNGSIDAYLFVAKVNARLDQPVSAIDTYKSGLDKFPANVSLLTGLARMLEGVNRVDEAVQCYKSVLKEDSGNVEAMCCVATHHFYTDQPEVALRFFSHLYRDSSVAMECGLIYYSHSSIGTLLTYGGGDTNMAYQCFRLALAANNDHPEACCNIAVLEMRKGNHEKARSLLETAMTLGYYTFEPFFNYALLSYELGELQAAYNALKKSLELFCDHPDSVQLMTKLQLLLSEV